MNFGGYFEPEEKKHQISLLEKKMSEPNFWNDKNGSEKVISELNSLKDSLSRIEQIKNKINDSIEMLEMLKIEYDVEIKDFLESDIENISKEIKNIRVELLLNGEYDKENAIFEIHSGAGGTEACDWAEMLYRMYTRYFDKKGYKYEVIDIQNGEEAGIKSVTLTVKGINTFGYLKCEKGVHRLVRISPFDSNSRRHTSFASVDVTPLFENKEINIDIEDKDIVVQGLVVNL